MKKLYLATITFVLMIMVTTTVTYAWLSLSTSNVVRNLELKTNLGDQLEISIDGLNYYQSLPSEVIISKLGRIVLTDITSMDGKTFEHGMRVDGPVIKNKDYVSIDFHFRTASLRAHEVYLANNVSKDITYNQTKDGTFIISRGKSWVSDLDFIYGPNDEVVKKGDGGKYYISDAIRVAIHEQPLNEEDERTEFSSKIFDLSGNEERGFGKPYGAFDYYNKKRGHIDLPEVGPNIIYALSEFSKTSPYALDNNSHILTLIKTDELNDKGMHYYKGQVTMNIWLEGWDADLFDAVFGDQVKMQFEFKAVHGLLI